MTQDMQTAIDRLRALPESDQQRIAPSINEYLNKLENLRRMIQEGIDSGPATEWDFEVFKQQVRARIAGEQRAAHGNG